jgi:hypothetical protein
MLGKLRGPMLRRRRRVRSFPAIAYDRIDSSTTAALGAFGADFFFQVFEFCLRAAQAKWICSDSFTHNQMIVLCCQVTEQENLPLLERGDSDRVREPGHQRSLHVLSPQIHSSGNSVRDSSVLIARLRHATPRSVLHPEFPRWHR